MHLCCFNEAMSFIERVSSAGVSALFHEPCGLQANPTPYSQAFSRTSWYGRADRQIPCTLGHSMAHKYLV